MVSDVVNLHQYIKVRGLDPILNEDSICIGPEKSMVPPGNVLSGQKKIEIEMVEEHFINGKEFRCKAVPGKVHIIDNISPKDAPCSDSHAVRDPAKCSIDTLPKGGEYGAPVVYAVNAVEPNIFREAAYRKWIRLHVERDDLYGTNMVGQCRLNTSG